MPKQWTEYARHAWDISPTLAVFLPSWLNCSATLVQVILILLNSCYLLLAQAVSRLVRSSPTRVCHIPQAVDYFLSEEMLVSKEHPSETCHMLSSLNTNVLLTS